MNKKVFELFKKVNAVRREYGNEVCNKLLKELGLPNQNMIESIKNLMDIEDVDRALWIIRKKFGNITETNKILETSEINRFTNGIDISIEPICKFSISCLPIELKYSFLLYFDDINEVERHYYVWDSNINEVFKIITSDDICIQYEKVDNIKVELSISIEEWIWKSWV